MNNERILAHTMAKKLTPEELENVSAAGTSTGTGHVTFSVHATDGDADVVIDM